MRLLIILVLIALPACLALPAFAEETPPHDPRGPMRYTKIQDAPAEDDGAIKLRTIKHEDGEADKPEEEETSQTRIWNKYKALATGQTEEERKAAAEKADKEEAEKKKETAVKETPKEEEKIEKEETKPTGIAALLDEYKKNKAARSQMRSLTVTKPAEAAETEKNEAQKEKPGI